MEYVISRAIRLSRPQVFSHEIDDQIVYVKQKRPKKNPIGKWAQRILFYLTKNILTVPTDYPEGNNVYFEVERLKMLAKNHIKVPEVLHVEDDYFVTNYVGKTLESVLKKHPELHEAYIKKAILALKKLHRSGFVHGASQVKNMTVHHEDIYFLDFEENLPSEHFDLFRLRDLFLFFFSLERNEIDIDVKEICDIYDEHPPYQTFNHLQAALESLPMVKLLDSQLFNCLKMRDIRSLNRLIRKFETAG